MAESTPRKQLIGVHTLQETADALGCNLRYVLIPRAGLQRQAKERAESLARQEARELDITMALEDQDVDPERVREWVEDRARELLASRRLWDDR